MIQTRPLPSIPEIGHSEGYYARKVREAEHAGDDHAREAFKVAQYITLGISPHLDWDQKIRYFQHALRRHCQPPPLCAERIWLFYAQLGDLVRQHCGQEALKLASREDDRFAELQHQGYEPKKLGNEAERFFGRLMGYGNDRPEYFNSEDWQQLRILREQWV